MKERNVHTSHGNYTVNGYWNLISFASIQTLLLKPLLAKVSFHCMSANFQYQAVAIYKYIQYM